MPFNFAFVFRRENKLQNTQIDLLTFDFKIFLISWSISYQFIRRMILFGYQILSSQYLQYVTVQFSSVWCNTVWYSMVQYSTKQYIIKYNLHKNYYSSLRDSYRVWKNHNLLFLVNEISKTFYYYWSIRVLEFLQFLQPSAQLSQFSNTVDDVPFSDDVGVAGVVDKCSNDMLIDQQSRNWMPNIPRNACKWFHLFWKNVKNRFF